MTREEIIRNLKYTMEKHKNDRVDTFGTNISLMCKDILDYLEQEPCEDCISREQAIRIAEQGQLLGYVWQFKELCKLPSIQPKPKTDVLDKIRAEIRKKMKFNSFNEGYVLYDDITEVIDKYKAKSEDKE